MDECGSNAELAPLRARAPRGERAHGKAPRNRGNNTTLLASMSAEGMGPCVAVEGATTARVFEASTSGGWWSWTTRGAQVRSGQGVSGGQRLRAPVPAGVLSGPQPDRGGLQQGQGALLRRISARTRGGLVGAMGRALDVVTLEDVRGFFELWLPLIRPTSMTDA